MEYYNLKIPNSLSTIKSAIGNLFYKMSYRFGANQYFIPDSAHLFGAIDKTLNMHYDAASTARTRSDWSTATGTPYSDIKNDLKKMIARSRASADNNGLSESIDSIFVSNVIGDAGIKPEPVVRDDGGELMNDANSLLAEGWARYNDQWDRSGHSTYYENQKLILRTIINSGSVLINLVPSKKGDFIPIANQIIEPDRLDWSKDVFSKTMHENKNVKQTQFGIGLDKYGAPVHFIVQGINKPVKAGNMSIRYRRKRTEQYIGVPWKASIMKNLFDVTNLLEDESMSSRIRAMISLWMKKKDAGAILSNRDSDGRVKWEPARIMYSDQKPEVIQSNNSENLDPFMRMLTRTIGTGVGLSYQLITKDLAGMNFASSRANILEDRRTFRMMQRWFIKEVCQKDWEVFVFWMFASGKLAPLTLTDYKADPWKWNQSHWQTTGWEWVDPLKDASAAILLNNNGMLSLKDIYGGRGKNYKAELNQIAEEQKYIVDLEEKHGVTITQTIKKEDSKTTQKQVDNLLAHNDGSYE